MAMPLSQQEKDDAAEHFGLLAQLNEPEQLLASMHRLAELQARKASNTPEERKRWEIVEEALMFAEASVSAQNSPQAQKLAAHMAEWSPGQPLDHYAVVDNTIAEMTRLRARIAELEAAPPAQPEGARAQVSEPEAST